MRQCFRGSHIEAKWVCGRRRKVSIDIDTVVHKATHTDAHGAIETIGQTRTQKEISLTHQRNGKKPIVRSNYAQGTHTHKIGHTLNC